MTAWQASAWRRKQQRGEWRRNESESWLKMAENEEKPAEKEK